MVPSIILSRTMTVAESGWAAKIADTRTFVSITAYTISSPPSPVSASKNNFLHQIRKNDAEKSRSEVDYRRYPLNNEELDKQIGENFKSGMTGIGITFGIITVGFLLAFGLVALLK